MLGFLGGLLRRAGYQAVRTELIKTLGGFGHARHLQNLIRDLKIDCVFDVGANKGQFRDLLRKEIGFNGRIISFEPLPDLNRFLMERAKADPAWVVVDCALGREAQTLTINETEGSDLSSFRKPSMSVDWPAKDKLAVRNMIEVPVNRLDAQYPALQKTHGFQNPLLKLDTQGYDLDVLHGAGETLSQFRVVQTELAFIPLYEDMPLYSEVIAHLEERLFAISGIYPISLDHSKRLIEADGIFVSCR